MVTNLVECRGAEGHLFGLMTSMEFVGFEESRFYNPISGWMCQGQGTRTAESEAGDIGVNNVKVSTPRLTVISLRIKFDIVIVKLLQRILRRNVPALDLNINILFLAMDPTRSGQPWQHGIFGCFDNCGICIFTYFLPCYTFGKKTCLCENVSFL